MKANNLRAGVRIAINLRAELNFGDARPELDFTVTPEQGQGAESISGDAWFPCRLLDMSDHGFLLVCSKALAVRQILDLRCKLYPDKLLECKVEIRHADATGIGARIVEIDQKSIGFCQLFLQEHYSDKLNKSG
jgi:hypothetical protein